MAKFNIDNIGLSLNLATLAAMCAVNGTDNCDIEINTNKGKFNCHIEFSDIEGEKSYSEQLKEVVDKYIERRK